MSTCSQINAREAEKVLELKDVERKMRGIIFQGPVLSGNSYQQLPV